MRALIRTNFGCEVELLALYDPLFDRLTNYFLAHPIAPGSLNMVNSDIEGAAQSSKRSLQALIFRLLFFRNNTHCPEGKDAQIHLCFAEATTLQV